MNQLSDLDLEQRVERVLTLSHLLCMGLDEPMYVLIQLQNRATEACVTRGKWVGCADQPRIKGSRARKVAVVKLAEILSAPAEVGQLTLSPYRDWPGSTGWMGGARMVTEEFDLAIACSKWRQEHDRLLAVILVYDALIAKVERIHHFGVRYSTRRAYLAANEAMESTPLDKPASDHERTYFQRGMYYQEHQWMPGTPWSKRPIFSRHWDLVVPNPEDLLRFVAKAFDLEPTEFDPEPNSPWGMVQIVAPNIGNRPRQRLALMARAEWSAVESW